MMLCHRCLVVESLWLYRFRCRVEDLGYVVFARTVRACVCRIRDRLRRTRERVTVSGFDSVHRMVLMFVPVRVDEDV
jgi:hypothetical protein